MFLTTYNMQLICCCFLLKKHGGYFTWIFGRHKNKSHWTKFINDARDPPRGGSRLITCNFTTGVKWNFAVALLRNAVQM